MGLIDPKTIKNPIHRKLIEKYGNMRANTPIKTVFHRLCPRDLEYDDVAAGPKYNLSRFVLDELIYRYYFGSNFTALVYGARSDYKSTFALRLKLWLEEIAGVKPDYNNIIDSDKDLLKLIPRYTAPPIFTTFIKDEWDTSRSGLGNMVISDTVKNMINRARYDRWNLIICTPLFKYYPVDYFFKAYEYTRYGKPDIMCLIFDESVQLHGHVILPMPSNEEIAKYEERKKVFMQHSRKLAFNIDEELMQIAEEAILDSRVKEQLEQTMSHKLGKIAKTVLADYIFTMFPELQSKTMKDNIILKLQWMHLNQTTTLPRNK